MAESVTVFMSASVVGGNLLAKDEPVEMTIVTRPFVLDSAGTCLDAPPPFRIQVGLGIPPRFVRLPAPCA